MDPSRPTRPAHRSARGVGLLAVVVVLTVLLVAPLAFVEPADATPLPVPEKRILLLHDSVSNGARNPIADAFPNNDIEWVGFGGLHVYNAVEILKERPDLVTSHVIVQLGTNYDNDPKKFRNDLDDLMEILADSEHVLWLKPSIFRAKIPELHAEIDAATRRYPTLHAADWNAVTEANAQYTVEDNIHLQGDGGPALAAFMYNNLMGVTPWNRIPQGNMGRTRVNRDRVTVKGWAFDPDIKGKIKLQIIVNGEVFGNVQTKARKPALRQRLNHESSRLGFTRRLTLPPGKHSICVQASNGDGLGKIPIGCQVIRVRT